MYQTTQWLVSALSSKRQRHQDQTADTFCWCKPGGTARQTIRQRSRSWHIFTTTPEPKTLAISNIDSRIAVYRIPRMPDVLYPERRKFYQCQDVDYYTSLGYPSGQSRFYDRFAF